MQWGPGTKFQGWKNLINIEYNLFTITYYKYYSHGIKCLDFSDELLSIEGQKKCINLLTEAAVSWVCFKTPKMAKREHSGTITLV